LLNSSGEETYRGIAKTYQDIEAEAWNLTWIYQVIHAHHSLKHVMKLSILLFKFLGSLAKTLYHKIQLLPS
jgi:hypothetical protein